MDIQLSSLPERINLYLNSANRTIGDSASSFEMVMSNTLITAETNEIFFINVIQFNTFNNFYQVQTGYNTDFEMLIFDSENIVLETIVGLLPEGNLSINDILSYMKTLLSGLVNIVYDKIKINLNSLMFHLMLATHMYILK